MVTQQKTSHSIPGPVTGRRQGWPAWAKGPVALFIHGCARMLVTGATDGALATRRVSRDSTCPFEYRRAAICRRLHVVRICHFMRELLTRPACQDVFADRPRD